MRNIMTGLDIGTSKICAAIAGVSPDGKIEIRGIGLAEAKGINKGFVSSLDKLIDSVSTAVKAAEDEAGVKAHNVVTNISGSSVAGKLNEGLVHLSRRGREITRRDINGAIETTKNISLTLERDFLYCVPQEFVVDDNAGVEDALGLFGTKLKVRLYVITALATHIQNISKAVSYAGYELTDIVPTLVASASCILRDEHKENGTLVIDMGGGITELAIYKNGMLRFFDSVNVGGMDLTASLSAHFKISFESAEMIKRKCAGISKEDLSKEKKSIFDVDNRHVTVNSIIINNLLKERFEEIFYILNDRLKSSEFFSDSMPAFMVTGGSSLLSGAHESFEDLLNIPIKRWRIEEIDADPSYLSNPVYSAAISLAKYGLDKEKKPGRTYSRGKSFLLDSVSRMRAFLDDYF
ncbi:MAG: cell division protein FtsA [Candidatus Omnitrophica bacterium]|nr:cell division protein FtsA [Candidatus Omnitrophota bacterium]